MERFEQRLIETHALTPEQAADLQAAVLAEVDEAQTWAEASPAPDPSELGRGVYCEDRPWP